MGLGHDSGDCQKSYIMNSALGSGANAFKWSPCSRNKLQTWFNDKLVSQETSRHAITNTTINTSKTHFKFEKKLHLMVSVNMILNLLIKGIINRV